MARHQVVLLIAGDGLIRKVTAAGLEMYGFEVLTADYGEQAAEMLRGTKRINVLVTNADLGGPIDGLAIARLAREMNPDIEVIYSSRTPQRIPFDAMVHSAPTLRDPYHPHQLVGVINHLRHRSPETAGSTAA